MYLLGIMYIKYSSYLLSFSLSRKKKYIYKGVGGLKGNGRMDAMDAVLESLSREMVKGDF